MHTRRRMIYKKRVGRVTQSQAHPHYSLDYCAAGMASEANWKPVILSEWNQGFGLNRDTQKRTNNSHVNCLSFFNAMLKQIPNEKYDHSWNEK